MLKVLEIIGIAIMAKKVFNKKTVYRIAMVGTIK